MASTPTCAGCRQKLPIKENIICVLCKCRYDFECAGVTKDSKKVTLENKNTWKCQTCICKLPKTGNTDTPQRPLRVMDANKCQPEDTNVTLRRKPKDPDNDTLCSDDLSFLGDTIPTEKHDQIDRFRKEIYPTGFK